MILNLANARKLNHSLWFEYDSCVRHHSAVPFNTVGAPLWQDCYYRVTAYRDFCDECTPSDAFDYRRLMIVCLFSMHPLCLLWLGYLRNSGLAIIPCNSGRAVIPCIFLYHNSVSVGRAVILSCGD